MKAALAGWCLLFLLCFSLAGSLEVLAVDTPADNESAAEAEPIDTSRFGLVISTLQDIVNTIDTDAAKEEIAIAQYQAWVDAETKGLAESATLARDNSEKAFVQIRELTATIATLQSHITSLNSDIHELQDAQEQLSNIRAEESAKYSEEVQLNTQSSRTVEKALTKLSDASKTAGFLQQSNRRLAPDNGYITGVLKGIQERLKTTMQELDQVEEAKKLEHDGLFSAKKDQLAALQAELVEKNTLLAQSKLDLVQAQRIYDEEQESDAAMQKMVDDTLESAAVKVNEYQVRKQDRAKERDALIKAAEVLQEESSATSTSFLQVASKHQGESKQSRQLKVKKAVQLMLMQTKDKAKGMSDAAEAVLGLVDAIQEHEAEDESRKKFCETQIYNNEAQKVKLEGAISRLKSRMEYLESEVNTIDAEVANLKTEAGSFKTRQEQFEAVRAQEVKAYEDSTRDRALTVKVVIKAKGIVQSFYSSEDPAAASMALLEAEEKAPNFRTVGNNYCVNLNGQNAGQTRRQGGGGAVLSRAECEAACKEDGSCTGYEYYVAGKLVDGVGTNITCFTFPGSEEGTADAHPVKAAEGNGTAVCVVKAFDLATGSLRKGALGESVTAMLDGIVMDFEQEQADADRAEQEALTALEKVRQDTKSNFDKKLEQVASLLQEKAREAEELTQVQADDQLKKESLTATGAALANLQTDCANLLTNFEQMKEDRQKQVNQLKDVADILGGASVGSRTGLKAGLLQLRSLKA